MSVLQSALAEIRTGVADRISVGLSADQCAALAQHIDQLQQAVLEADDRPEGWSATVADAAAEARALVPGRQDTPAETRTCTGCDGTGERRDFNTDGEFESVERCGGCDGTGRVAIEADAESGAAR